MIRLFAAIAVLSLSACELAPEALPEVGPSRSLTSVPTATVPEGSIDCLGDVGPSQPEEFTWAMSQARVRPGLSSASVDFYTLDANCTFGLQVDNVMERTTLSAADCEGFKRWLTSDRLLVGLASGCGDGTGDESVEVAGMASKKFSGCTEEPFPSHRACLAKLRSRYFPGK